MCVIHSKKKAICLFLYFFGCCNVLLAQKFTLRPQVEAISQFVDSENIFGDSILVFENSQRKMRLALGFGIDYKLGEVNVLSSETMFFRTLRDFAGYNTKEYCCIAKGVVFEEQNLNQRFLFERRVYAKESWQGYIGVGAGLNVAKNKVVNEPIYSLDEYYGYQDVFTVLNALAAKKYLFRKTGELLAKISVKKVGLSANYSILISPERAFKLTSEETNIFLRGCINSFGLKLDYSI